MTDASELLRLAGLCEAASPEARKLILQMGDGEYVSSLADMARDAGLPLPQARKAMAELKALGVTKTGSLHSHNEDGKLCGRGTWLTVSGLRLRAIASTQEQVG